MLLKNWGKQKETLLTTYKAIVRPHLEYGCTIWSPILSESNTQKLQTIQNSALRITTGCTRDTNSQHLHAETKTLPIQNHLKLHASLFREKSLNSSHPCFNLTQADDSKRQMKRTIFDNSNYTLNIPNNNQTNLISDTDKNCATIHHTIVQDYFSSLQPNKILQTTAPEVDSSELSLPRDKRCILAQLRTGKSSFLLSYLNNYFPSTYPSPLCPACNLFPHDVFHLFDCNHFPTSLTPIDLWNNPVDVAELLTSWSSALPHLKR